MSAVLKEVAPAQLGQDPRYGCVLNLLATNAGGALECGHAVLVAPDLALTAAHCVMQWQQRLQVRSVQGGAPVDVASVYWAGGAHHVYGSPAQQFPHVPLDTFSDDIVALKLAAPLPVPCATLASAPQGEPYAVRLTCADRRHRSGVRRVALQVATELRGLAVAVDPADGALPSASGAPAFLDDYGDAPPRLVGLQACVGALPEGVPLSLAMRYAGLVPLTPARMAWIERLRRAPLDDLLAEGGIETALLRGPRRFVIRRDDGSLHSGGDTLIEIDDLDYFHLMPWRLLATGTLELLTSEGALWTTRVGNSTQLRLQIVTHPEREVIDLILHAGGSAAAPWPWLAGSVWFKQHWVHVYLYRRSEDAPPGQCCNRGRVRIEAYIDGGAHAADRPDAHERVYDDGSIVAGQPLPPTRRDPASSWGFAQDEVGSGQEGHRRR